MEVNLRGPMLAYKFANHQMVKQCRGGRLIGGSELHLLKLHYIHPYTNVFISGLIDSGKEKCEYSNISISIRPVDMNHW